MNFQEFKSLYQFQPVKEYPNKVATQPKVTVCIQTYNHELFITQCLESILEQKTDFPFEIIVSDDDSIDKTRELCISFAEKYPNKIKLFLHSRINNIEVGGEPTGNFPTLYNLFSANGKFIAICEGDDYWGDPLKLQKQFDFMEANPSYSICYHDFKIINEFGSVINSDKAFSLIFDLSEEELKFPWIHPSTLTIFFRNNISLSEEVAEVLNMDIFFYSLLGKIGKGKFLENVNASLYRVHSGGIWSLAKYEEKMVSKIHTYKKLSKYYLKVNDRKAYNEFNQRKQKLKIILFRYYLKNLSFKKMQLSYLIKIRNFRSILKTLIKYYKT